MNMRQWAKGSLSRLFTWLDSVVRWLSYVAMVLVGALTVGITYEVVVRYFFNRPTIWAQDFSMYILLYITFLAAAWVQMEHAHVTIDVTLQALNPRTKRVMQFVTLVMGTLASAFWVWQSFRFTLHSFHRSEIINRPVQVPEFIILGIIPVGAFFLFLVFLKQLCQLVMGMSKETISRD